MSPRRRVSLFAAALLSALQAFALEIPPAPTQWVTDTAGLLNSADLQALNEKLRAFEQRSGAQFIIYIFRSLEGESLEDFTIRAAERWKVGQKKYDNGLILFVFVNDRRTRIEVGYGLEGTITDAYASRVLRQTLGPYFQRGDYAGGLNAAADQIIARIEGKEAPVPTRRAEEGEPYSLDCSDIFFILFIFLMVIFVFTRAAGSGCWLPLVWPGGVTFGSGGWSGGGGWSSGGGFGGFSGGGGSFGGGGASGSW